MITKIHKPQAHSSNKGSSANAVEYLEKENNDKNFLEQTHFFNQHSDMISGNQTQNMLDRNKGRLSKDETKFYMLTINPSPNELAHIGKSDANLRDFTNAVMDEYAKNFNREYEKGIPLEGKDLMYFAKIENNRTFKYSNKKDRIPLEFNKAIKDQISKHKKKAIKSPDYKKEAAAEIKILESQFMRTQAGKIIKEP